MTKTTPTITPMILYCIPTAVNTRPEDELILSALPEIIDKILNLKNPCL